MQMAVWTARRALQSQSMGKRYVNLLDIVVLDTDELASTTTIRASEDVFSPQRSCASCVLSVE